jgi:ATP citrate (pro-S)-lyase
VGSGKLTRTPFRFALTGREQELGLIRRPAAFISTISDERGQELLYAGMRISEVFKEEIGIGGVLSLLWFKRRK